MGRGPTEGADAREHQASPGERRADANDVEEAGVAGDPAGNHGQAGGWPSPAQSGAVLADAVSVPHAPTIPAHGVCVGVCMLSV